MTRYGSEFTFIATPCKPIFGTVREKGSGKPIADADIRTPFERDDQPTAWAKTDKEGNYRLIGLPARTHRIHLHPAANTPYIQTETKLDASAPGIEPVRHDIEVERQPAVSGRVIDAAAGNPVRGWVEYRPLAKNPNLKKNTVLSEPRWGNHPPMAMIDVHGRFLLPVLRGPGVLLVQAERGYPSARLAKEDRISGVANATDPELIDCRPHLAWPAEFHAYRLIDISEGTDAEVEIRLAAGNTRPLVLEFPDGKSHETTVLGLRPIPQDHGDHYTAGQSAVSGLADEEQRRLFISTNDGNFAASVLVKASVAGPVNVKLEPTGVITGRIVDKDGNPIPDVSFQVYFNDGDGRPGVFVHGGCILRALTDAEIKRTAQTHGYYEHSGVKVSLGDKTDAQGRFRISGMMANVPFNLNARLVDPPNAKGQRFITAELIVARPTVKPGETLDLGDLRAVAPPKK